MNNLDTLENICNELDSLQAKWFMAGAMPQTADNSKATGAGQPAHSNKQVFEIPPRTDLQDLQKAYRQKMDFAFRKLFHATQTCVEQMEQVDPQSPELAEMKKFLAEWSAKIVNEGN